MRDNTLYWLWLASLTDISQTRRNKLAWTFAHPRQIYDAGFEQLVRPRILSKNDIDIILSSRSLSLAQKVQDYLDRYQIHFLTRFDQRYPTGLLEAENPPAWIFARGNIDLIKNKKIGIFGSEMPGRGGLNQTQRTAEYLSSEGISVVSGFRPGIDEQAHESALRRSGSTIAVTGCGINVSPDSSMNRLYDQILRDGLVITERFLNERPTPKREHRRLRLLATLPDQSVIIDAQGKDESMRLAQTALKKERAVFYPSRYDSSNRSSVIQLHRMGAKPFDDTRDLLDQAKRADREHIDQMRRAEPLLDLDVPITAYVHPADDSKPKETDKKKKGYDPELRLGLAGLTEESFSLLKLIRKGFNTTQSLLEESGIGLIALNEKLRELEDAQCVRIDGGKIHIL